MKNVPSMRQLKRQITRALIQSQQDVIVRAIEEIDPRDPQAHGKLLAYFVMADQLQKEIWRIMPWYLQLFWWPTRALRWIRSKVLWFKLAHSYICDQRARKEIS